MKVICDFLHVRFVCFRSLISDDFILLASKFVVT